MSDIVDAFIEIPDDPAQAAAFVGDARYSPLGLALAALRASPRLRRILLPLKPEWRLDARFRRVLAVAALDPRVRLPEASDTPDLPARAMGRNLRAWNHAGCLFGTMMTTEFCAYGNPARILGTLSDPRPDYVLIVGGVHGFLTAEVVEALFEQGDATEWRTGLYCADGPTGLIPVMWSLQTLTDSRDNDALAQSFFWQAGRYWYLSVGYLPTRITQLRRGFDLTTARSRAFCQAVAERLACEGRDLSGGAEHPPLALSTVAAAGEAEFEAWVGALPRDVEIEVTPRREINPAYLPPLSRPQVDMSLETFERIVRQLEPNRDSVNLTLGGFGDPLEHPNIEEMVKLARPYVRVICLRTFGLKLTRAALDALSAAGVDVFNVRFGYWGRELYREINGADRFDELCEVLSDFREEQVKSGRYEPLILPEVVKGFAGDKTLTDFYAYWRSHATWMMVAGYNTWGGAIEADTALDLFPGTRRPCLKITEQMPIFADGRVPLCAQDFDGKHSIGDASRERLTDIWRSERLQALRRSQVEGAWGREHAPCERCNQWFRL